MRRARPPGRSPIDWEEARARLERARTDVHLTPEVPPERARAIMEERARALARPVEGTPEPEDLVELLSFEVAGRWFAIETRHVRCVVDVPGVTAVPGAPAWITGVAMVRSEILPVVDLAVMPGGARTVIGGPASLVVVGPEDPDLALLTSSVGELRSVPRGELLAPPDELADALPLLAVTGDGLVVLDGHGLREDGRLILEHGDDAGG